LRGLTLKNILSRVAFGWVSQSNGATAALVDLYGDGQSADPADMSVALRSIEPAPIPTAYIAALKGDDSMGTAKAVLLRVANVMNLPQLPADNLTDANSEGIVHQMSAFNGHSGAREITIPNANHGNVAAHRDLWENYLRYLLSGTTTEKFHSHTGKAP
jgi:hypothetical protein